MLDLNMFFMQVQSFKLFWLLGAAAIGCFPAGAAPGSAENLMHFFV